MKLRALVTGGAGFIGSHLVEALLERGLRVIVVDDFSEGRMSNLDNCRHDPRLTIVRMDVRDPQINRVLRGVTEIYHLAALVGVQSSLKDPRKVNNVNVDGTLNLLVAAQKSRVSRFVYASSAAVYGFNKSAVQKETMSTNPATPYAVSKLAAETYCKVFHGNHGLNTVSLRFFNVYGPRQRSGPYSSVITSFSSRVSVRKPLTIFGNGRQVRDFVYVSDVVQALLLSLESERAIGKTINIGTGKPTSINELATTIIHVFGHKRFPIVRKPAREGDIRHSCADISAARESLGYRPKVELEDGIRRALGFSDQQFRSRV
jgi:UDP-glucose 4-epimerase